MSSLGIRRALEATCPHCRKKIRVHDGEFPKVTYIQYSLFGGATTSTRSPSLAPIAVPSSSRMPGTCGRS